MRSMAGIWRRIRAHTIGAPISDLALIFSLTTARGMISGDLPMTLVRGDWFTYSTASHARYHLKPVDNLPK